MDIDRTDLLSQEEIHSQILHTKVIFQLTKDKRPQSVESGDLGHRTRKGSCAAAVAGLIVRFEIAIRGRHKSSRDDRVVIGRAIERRSIAVPSGGTLSSLAFSSSSTEALWSGMTGQARRSTCGRRRQRGVLFRMGTTESTLRATSATASTTAPSTSATTLSRRVARSRTIGLAG